jgi:hypothetical protein
VEEAARTAKAKGRNIMKIAYLRRSIGRVTWILRPLVLPTTQVTTRV